MGRTVGGSSLRARLLVGVAAAAMAAPVANRALAQDAAKFAPYVEAGGMVGTHSFGDVDIFIPVWQDQTSVLFGDLRGTFSAQPTEEGNFGLGYRTQVSPEWILGGYGYFDIANSPNDNLFYQITLGVELKSVDWDFRLNGYIPINPDGSTINKNSNPDIHINGNTIKMTTESRDEKALYGFDGEVGWRVPVFPADGDFDIRVYAGGYYFTNGDVDTIAGPRGRIEARLYDIDFLGLQSRLTAQGVIQWDQPRGTQGWGGLELRIPLGAITGSASPKLNPLDRRMVDRVYRDINIVTEKTQPKTTSEDVIVDELTVSTHTIVFANSGGAGSGAKGSPIDLNAAPGKGQTLGSNAIILADGGAGNITITNPLQLSNGQALIGGGSIVPLTGAKSGKTVDFKFSGSRPTLVATDSGHDAIDMATRTAPTELTQNEIWGVNIQGTFENGIFGGNMERAIVKNSVIVADDAGRSGIYIVQYGPNPQASSFVHVANNSVSGAPDDGIKVNNFLSDGASHTQTVVISYNTVAVNLDDGIEQINEVNFAGTSFTQGVRINSNVASANGFAGIEVSNTADSGATIVQALLIDPNTVVENAYFGILVENTAFNGSTISQAVAILDNTVNDNGFVGFPVTPVAPGGLAPLIPLIVGPERGGIVLDNGAVEDGSITQGVKIDGNTVNHNGTVDSSRGIGIGSGISLYNLAIERGAIVQAGEISGNVVLHNSENGIALGNGVTSSTITQNLTIAGNRISYNHSDGIFNKNDAFFGTLAQTLSIDNDIISHNGESGIFVENFFTTSTVNQDITVDPTTITDNSFGPGIFVFGEQEGGTLVQNIAVLNSTISDNAETGILIEESASFGASFTQTVTLTGNSIANNLGAGVIIDAGVESDATLLQTVVATGNSINNNHGIGLGVFTNGFYDAAVVQNVTAAGNTFDENSSTGIAVSAGNDSHAGSLTQDVLISGNTVLNTAESGFASAIYVGFSARTLASAQHNVTIVNNTVSGATEDGIAVSANIANITTAVGSTVSIAGNNVSNIADLAGIFVRTNVSSAATVNQVVTITGNSVAYIHRTGIYLESRVSSGGTLIQTAVIDDNVIDNIFNGKSIAGILVGQQVDDGFMSQSLTVNGNQITQLNAAADPDNGAVGIVLDSRISSNGTLSQTAFINDNIISDIHGKYAGGIAVFNDASGVGASLSQNLTIDSNSIASLHGVNIGQDGRGGYALGIGVVTRVASGGVATQTLTIEDNVIHDLSAGAVVNSAVSGVAIGIGVANYVEEGRLSQTVAINDNTISEFRAAYAVGIAVVSEVSGPGAFMTQSVTIDPNTIANLHGTNNEGGGYVAGIAVSSHVHGDFASASQSITIEDNILSGLSAGRAAVGIGVANDVGTSSQLSQSVAITGNAIALAGEPTSGVGILVYNFAWNGALSQTLSVANNVVSGSDLFVGVGIGNRAAGGASIGQNLTIAGNQIGPAYIAGIGLGSFARFDGGTVSQTGVISNNVVAGQTGTSGAGLVSILDASGAGDVVTQALQITNNTLSNNANDGIYVIGSAGAAGTTKLDWTLAGNHITGNGGNGIKMYNTGAGGTQTMSLVTNSGNVINNNVGFGVYLHNAGGAGPQVFNLSGTVLSGNNGGGAQTSNNGGTINP